MPPSLVSSAAAAFAFTMNPSITIPIAVSGANTYLVVGAVAELGAASVFRHNGSDLDLIGTATLNSTVGYAYGKAAPDAGTLNAVVSGSGFFSLGAVVTCFQAVSQSAPVNPATTETNASGSISASPTASDECLGVSVLAVESGTAVQSVDVVAPSTLIRHGVGGTATNQLAIAYGDSTGSASWTQAGTLDLILTAFTLNPSQRNSSWPTYPFGGGRSFPFRFR